MRLAILSRASDLARLQAMLVARALEQRWPAVEIVLLSRSAAGDRDLGTPLADWPEPGVFTADLTERLASGAADLVVHSWKDLPLESRSGTVIAGTLERADPRDVLLIRRDVVAAQPAALRVLSSSPRRAWLLERALPQLLPWRVDRIEYEPVRGNIQTRLQRLQEGRGDALVVAKAALDRLLQFGSPFEDAAKIVRSALDACRWMVMPLRDMPGAPAQGAIAIEASLANQKVRDLVAAISHAPTWRAVMRERAVLAAHGGGCHEAVGATVLPRAFGDVISVRARTTRGSCEERWAIENPHRSSPQVDAAQVWPRPDERTQVVRRQLDVAPPAGVPGLLVARAEALPASWTIPEGQLLWAAGGMTWRKLASQARWVNGCSDGLGDRETPNADALAGRPIDWLRVTHVGAADAPKTLATYAVELPLPTDLGARTHFFWTSGQMFRSALERFPSIRAGWHASGPGRTADALVDALGDSGGVSVWLSYEQWYEETVRL